MAKEEVKYSVTSKNGQGFRRSGILFGPSPTILDENQITKEILNEGMLTVDKFVPKVKEQRGKKEE